MLKKVNKRNKIRKAVIPVAGFGTRFLPATIAQPKEMLPIVDKPIIQYIVEEVAAAGIEEVIFVTGRAKRAIEDHFDYSAELEQTLKDGEKTDLLREVHRISRLAKFVYVRQNKPLGDGHALLMAKELIGDEPFAFVRGDDVIDSKKPAIQQLIEAYQQKRSSIIGVVPVPLELAHRYGIMKPKGQIKGKTFAVETVVEKPKNEDAPSRFANPGRYIFTPDIFSFLEKTKPSLNGEIFVTEAVRLYARRRPLFAHHITGRYFDCGSKTEYVKANIYMSLKHSGLRQQIKAYLRKPV